MYTPYIFNNIKNKVTVVWSTIEHRDEKGKHLWHGHVTRYTWLLRLYSNSTERPKSEEDGDKDRKIASLNGQALLLQMVGIEESLCEGVFIGNTVPWNPG